QFSRRLATQEQHDFAVAERERLLRDPEFRAKVFNGFADETDRWIKIVQAAAAPVAPPDYDWSKDVAKWTSCTTRAMPCPAPICRLTELMPFDSPFSATSFRTMPIRSRPPAISLIRC